MSISSPDPLIAGVELGGTKCICILGTGPGAVLERVRIRTTTPQATLAAIEAVFDRWNDSHDLAAIGVASFGPLDLDQNSDRYGQITATTKEGWRGTDVGQRISHRYGLPTAIDTDVAGAALAEGRWGGAIGCSTYAYVTVGTGVGAGLVIDGRALHGLGHPEAGHIRVGRMAGDSWPGACPFHGDCVEGLASGYAIAARAGRAADQISPDDPSWRFVAHAIAGLCHNLVLTVSPEVILIGGGVIAGQPHLLDRVRAELVSSLAGYGDTIAISPRVESYLSAPALGDDAGPFGAIALGLAAVPGP